MFNKSKFYISINFNLRHINRFTIYCYKSRFRGYYKEYLESKISFIFDSNLINIVVGQEELESSTSAVSERHSNQLNY